MISEPPEAIFSLLSILWLSWPSMGIVIGFMILLFLITCSALISGAEVAYFSLSPLDKKHLNEDGSSTSLRILGLLEKPRSLLATILISNNFVNIAIIVVSDYLLKQILPEHIFEQWAQGIKAVFPMFPLEVGTIASFINFSIAVVLVTFILVLFGEITPKIYANMHNLKFSQWMSLPLFGLTKLLSPFSSILVKWAKSLEHRLAHKQATNISNNKDNIDKAIDLATTGLDTSDEEVDILKGIIKFNDVTVKQIIKSRGDVVGMDHKMKFKEILGIIKDSGYSRFPVFEENFDSIIGLLYAKDLLGLRKEKNDYEWQKYIRKSIFYVPETKKINELLKEFQLKRMHMAIVVDEYGGSSGIVTLEDVVEEVIGDIKDEFDEHEDDFEMVEKNMYLFKGKSLLNDVCRGMNISSEIFDSHKGNADSLGGFILELVGSIPKKNVEIKFKNLSFKIVNATKRKIKKVLISLNED